MSYKGFIAKDTISKGAVTEDEISQIVARLSTSGTKSGGQPCKIYEDLKSPGYGLAMCPVINGIETRFIGGSSLESKEVEVRQRLHSTQTKASQARIDNPRILLYPERTTLMNNVERIVAFQQTGALVKQAMMERRETWYN